MTNIYTSLVFSGLYPIISSAAALLVVLAMMFAVYAIAVSSERHRWQQTVRYHMPSEHRRQLDRLEAERDRLEAALEAERHTVAALHLELGAIRSGLSVDEEQVRERIRRVK